MDPHSQGLLSVGTAYNTQNHNQNQAHLKKNRNKWNQVVITEYDTKDLLARYQHSGSSDDQGNNNIAPFLKDTAMKLKR